MANTLAQTTYETRYDEIQQQLSELQTKLKTHQEKFSESPDNWGFVGDLTAVKDNLAFLLSFLK